jgi:hypothetical protein
MDHISAAHVNTSFHAVPSLPLQMDDRGNLASFSKAPGTFNRPFDKDGARAFAALSAQVSRAQGGAGDQKVQ